MQIVLKDPTPRRRPDCAELCFTIEGKPAAVMVLALDSAGCDAQGVPGAVRERLWDLIDRIDDWIRKGGRIVVSREEFPCAVGRRLLAAADRAQGG